MADAPGLDLADDAPIMIWASGPDAACCYFNRSWLQFTGRTLEQELGAGWLEGVHPEDSAACMRDYLAAFERRAPFTLEYRLRRHDGEYRWIIDAGVPRHGASGEFQGYVGGVLDISEHKRIETELRQSQHGLQALAARVEKDLGRAEGASSSGRQIDDMLHAVRRIADHIGLQLAERVAHELLSKRELQILCLIGGGSGPKEIAARLNVTANTVGTYRARVLRKLGMRNNAELVRYALEHKLVA